MAILNFMLSLPGKEKKATYFVQKIHKSIFDLGLEPPYNFLPSTQKELSEDFERLKIKSKLHTIRRDQHNRWKVGMMIDFYINARTKKMFRFAPRVPVKSLQKITFTWKDSTSFSHVLGTAIDRVCVIEVDGRFYGDAYFYQGKLVSGTYTLEPLATNDGFDTVQEFFDWFHEDFSGKIIHWTDLKY